MYEAAVNLKALKLSTFPGRNISKFVNEAQRLIKIMKDGYALPYQLGSNIVTKMCGTQSLYFNRSMYNVLDRVLAMEKAHRPHRDPKALEKSGDYNEYGPLGTCVKMRECYSNLVTAKQWPALAATIPSANLGSATGDNDAGPHKNPNGRKYHDCESNYHFRGHPYCSKKKTSVEDDSTGGGSTGGGKGNEDWKFIHPTDANAVVIVNETKYYFCKHCVCKQTGRQGFFNRTHVSKGYTFKGGKTYDDEWIMATDESSTASSISSLGSRSATPEGNLTALTRKVDELSPPPQASSCARTSSCGS